MSHQHLLNKLTIVVFSYNRHKILKRTIKYWSNYETKLVILDGSQLRLEFSDYNTKNIKYIHDPRGLYERLLSSVNFIDTEYMILACDDEFYLPSALSSCIQFLNQDSSFSCCGGRAMGFGTYASSKKVFGVNIYPKLKNRFLDDCNPKKRISKHFNNYTQAHLYSVIRTAKWKIICKSVFQKEFNFYAAWELQIEFLVASSGKSMILQELLWMRNLETQPIRGTSPSMSQQVRISDWWVSKNFQQEKKDFFSIMKRACDELSIETNSQLMKDDIGKLFEYYIYNKFSSNNFHRNKVKSVVIKAKNFFKRYIKWDIIKFYVPSKYKPLFKNAKLFETNGVKVNFDDLSRISSSLIDQDKTYE